MTTPVTKTPRGSESDSEPGESWVVRSWSAAVDVARRWLGSALVREYGANAGWLIATRAAWFLSAATIGIYVARRLGPHDFGVLNHAMAFTGIFATLASLSVEEVVIRQLVRDPEHRDRHLGNFFVLRLGLFALMACALGLALRFATLTAQAKVLCAILACGYFGLVLQGTAMHFQATVQSRYVAIAGLVACAINSATRLVSAVAEWPLAVFAWAEASINLLTFSGTLYYYWRHVASPLRWTWDRRETLALLATALPIGICGIFNVIDTRIDQLMLQHFLGAEAVGHYSVASRLTENWNLLSYLLCLSFFPAIASASLVSEAAYRKQIHRLYFLLFYSMVAVSIGTVVIGYPVVRLLFGTTYLAAVPVLNVLVWSTAGSALLYVFSQWAVNENRLALITWAVAAGVALKILLNVAFIERFGAAGVAWSSLVSIPTALAIILLLSRVGRAHLHTIVSSLVTLPSFKLGEHASDHK